MTFFFTSIFLIMTFWRPQEWLVPQMYGWPVLDVVVVMAILTLMMEIDTNRVSWPRDAPQLYLLIGLFFATLMSHVANTYFAGMVATIQPTGKMCLFTLLFFCVLNSPRRLRITAQIFVGMAVFMGIHAYLQQTRGYGFARQPPIWMLRPGETVYQPRSLFFGIFGDPNDLAQILVTAIPFAFTIFRKHNGVTLAISTAVALFLLQAALYTHSRGGHVAIGAGAAILVLLILPPRWLPWLAPLLALGALALCPFSSRVLDVSARERVVFWGYANEYFKRNFLFGIGYDMFWMVARDRAAHNAFVDTYTELGLFGYWFWFSLMQIGVVGSWRTRIAFARSTDIEEAWLRRFAGLAIMAMASFASSSYFLSRGFVYPLFFLFAILGAVPRVAYGMMPRGSEYLITLKRDWLTWGSVGSVASVFYIYVSILLLNRAWGG